MYYRCKANVTRYAITNQHTIVSLTSTEDGRTMARVIKILPPHEYYSQTKIHRTLYTTPYRVTASDFLPLQTFKEL